MDAFLATYWNSNSYRCTEYKLCDKIANILSNRSTMKKRIEFLTTQLAIQNIITNMNMSMLSLYETIPDGQTDGRSYRDIEDPVGLILDKGIKINEEFVGKRRCPDNQ